MSQPASHRAAASTIDDQDQDDGTNGIPLGAYREAERTVSGTYLPEREVVVLEGVESDGVVEVSLRTWLEWSQGKTIDRVARQRRQLLHDGEFFDQPVCSKSKCPCRLTPIEIERSEEAGWGEKPQCRRCLSQHFEAGELPPWVSPEDRTIDRSAIRAVRGAGSAPCG